MINNNKTFIWAHRGASGYIKDNTLDSFKLAIEQGADGIESDARLTKDNKLIFYHDSRIEWNSKSVRPESLTFEEIQSIDLDKEGRKVPSVESIFKHFQNVQNSAGKLVSFSLDITGKLTGEALIEIAKKFGMEERVALTFDDYRLYKHFRSISDKIVLVDSAKVNIWKKISNRIFYNNFQKLNQYKIVAVNLKAEDTTDEFIKLVKSNSMKIYVWNCHTEESLRKFYKKHVDGVYSNYPDLAVRIRNEIQGK